MPSPFTVTTVPGRCYFSGPYEGFWATFGELPDDTLRQLAKLLRHQDRGARSVDESNLIMVGICRLMVDEWIVGHNLTGHDVQPLPIGPGLFDALGYWPSIMLLDQRGSFDACRREAERRRLWQPAK